MRFRKLRIAWSVFWGLACVLLIVLWVRSYSKADSLGGTTSAPRVFMVMSRYGLLHILNFDDTAKIRTWELECEPLTADEKQFDKQLNRTLTTFGFGLLVAGSDYNVMFPYWLPFVIAGLLAVAPNVRWSKQFTLRTLLITTMLVAVVLGLAVYAASK